MEHEIKFAPVPPHIAQAVVADPMLSKYIVARGQTDMQATYYDTADQKLYELSMSARVRSENGRSIFTLKGAPEQMEMGLRRTEIEVAASSVRAGADALAAHKDTPPKAAKVLKCELLELCKTRFVRKWALYEDDKVSFEIACDHGQAERGRRIAQIEELEIEYKKGDATRMYEIAKALGEKYDLKYSTGSKQALAMALTEESIVGRKSVSPYFIGSQMLQYCVSCGYLEFAVSEDKRLNYYLTELGEKELPARFGVDLSKPCAFLPEELDL